LEENLRINIKKFAVAMELKNTGMELEVRDTQNNFLGDLCIKRSGVEWCAGRKKAGHGVLINWDEFINLFKPEE
jgi:hypothetical protein